MTPSTYKPKSLCRFIQWSAEDYAGLRRDALLQKRSESQRQFNLMLMMMAFRHYNIENNDIAAHLGMLPQSVYGIYNRNQNAIRTHIFKKQLKTLIQIIDSL